MQFPLAAEAITHALDNLKSVGRTSDERLKDRRPCW
jgi:hypothetical protein